jgi:hypothetical protein
MCGAAQGEGNEQWTYSALGVIQRSFGEGLRQPADLADPSGMRYTDSAVHRHLHRLSSQPEYAAMMSVLCVSVQYVLFIDR